MERKGRDVIYTVEGLLKGEEQVEIDGRWVAARPMRMPGLDGLMIKLKSMWLILTDRADAVIWYKQ